MKRLLIVLAELIVIIVAAVFYTFTQRDNNPLPQIVTSTDMSVPKLEVREVAGGLSHPWGIAFLPDKSMIVTERQGSISRVVDGKLSKLMTPEDVRPRGEGGMLGVAVDKAVASNRFLYTCFNTASDVRVVRWQLSNDQKSLVNRQDIVTGIPSNQSGRHSGCQLATANDGNLWIGTGDAALETNPQDLKSLGGKVLRVDRNGKSVTGNLGGDSDPRIFSYGHRNIQGIVLFDKPVNGSYGYSAEHGSDRDDEINALVPGNFGWDPGTGYDESVSMTDSSKFPQAIKAIWVSGNPTVATGGLTVLRGQQWGSWNGKIAVSILKNQQLRIIGVKDGKTVSQTTLFENTYGRLRAAVLGPDGALYFSTDRDSGAKILKLTPQV